MRKENKSSERVKNKKKRTLVILCKFMQKNYLGEKVLFLISLEFPLLFI